MLIIKHKRENVDFYSLTAFKKIILETFCLKDSAEFKYAEDNTGVQVRNRFYTWTELAEELEWFDEAEIVTDKNDKERVMVWLNVA